MAGTTIDVPVDRPVDGDTVRAMIDGASESLRILALDTEESKPGGGKPVTPWGKKAAEHIDRILTRVTLVGAIYMSAVCVLPTLLAIRFNVPFYFGGTALLIVVGVGLDTISQVEAHLVSRQYEGFVRGTRIRGRLSR